MATEFERCGAAAPDTPAEPPERGGQLVPGPRPAPWNPFGALVRAIRRVAVSLVSLRFAVPGLFIALAAILSQYTIKRDQRSAEDVVRGYAVAQMMDRMYALQAQIGMAAQSRRNDRFEFTLPRLDGGSESEETLIADTRSLILSATGSGAVGRSLHEILPRGVAAWNGEPLHEVVERVRRSEAGEVHVAGAGRLIFGFCPAFFGPHRAGVVEPDRTGVVIMRRDLSRDLSAARASVFNHTMESVQLILASAAVVGLLIHLGLTLRLNRVVRATERFTAGDLDRRVRIGGLDEVAQLGRAFNRMAEHVADTQRSLEHRVEVRTLDLARLVRNLKLEVAERQRVEQALTDEKELMRVTLASIGEAVLTTDPSGCVTYVNPAAALLLGDHSESLVGQPMRQVMRVTGDQTAEAQPKRLRCFVTGSADEIQSGSASLLRGGARPLPIDYCVAPIREGSGLHVGTVWVLRDDTEAQNAARRLSYQASHDALTGLVNRAEFERRLGNLLKVGPDDRTHCALYIDLDQFKIVNDTCGHAAGDELLRQIKDVLMCHVRQHDTFARLGGDEFGVLLEACSIDQALRVADLIRLAVQEFRFSWGEHTFSIGASIGLVSIDPKTDTVASVFQAADTACYAAKEQGRNRVQVFSQDDCALVQRHGEMLWVPRIQEALSNDRFVLYYQPIVPLSGGLERHGEILLRMRDRDGKLVMPSAFIPSAERYKQMQDIDRWVIRNAFRSLAQWNERNAEPLSLSVNVSGQSLSDEGFLSFVERELIEWNVPLDSVCFEITETAVVSNLTHAKQFFTRLKSRGARFALDDFGSGLSSFSYLKNLPVDYLKIDGSFVKDMATDPIDRAMVEAIHRVGNVMGLETIAEFVEDDEIAQELTEIGVNYGQGYGLGKPRPLADLFVSGYLTDAPASRLAL
ncbi:EAL domain-containing protein [Methylolobus aquaticus]